MVFDINAGPRAQITAIEIDSEDAADRAALANTRLAVGRPYDFAEVDEQLGKLRTETWGKVIHGDSEPLWIAAMDGRFELASPEGLGTKLRAELPCAS